MLNIVPDVIARIRLSSTEEGGRKSPIPAKQFGCPFYFQGEGFDCRLLLDQVGIEVKPGQTAEVPIKFLFPENVKARLSVGSKFKLWDGAYFAEGEVLELRL